MKMADLYKAKALGLEKGSGGGGGDYLELSGGTMSGDINMDGNAVTGIGTPTNAGDATPKGYVDDKIDESKEAFVAVYGRTTYEDVVAAIDANKVIMLDMPANHNLFNMTYVTYTNGGNAIMHAIFRMNDRPTLMTATLTPADHWTIAHTDLQDKLVSGTNIKTINNESILGSGNIDVGGWESGVFLAKQHFTTAQELIAAYEAKKVILLETTASPGGYEFVITQLRKNSGTSCNIVGYRVPDADPTKGIQICRSRVSGSEWSSSAQYVQNRLVSGTNIKTINGESILGEGNLDVGGGTVDYDMSDTSENAVQNKVIKAYVDQKAEFGIGGGGTDPLIASVSNASNNIRFEEQTYGNVYFQIAAESVDPFSTTLASREFVEQADDDLRDFILVKETELRNDLGDLSNLTTDEKTNLVGAINEVYEKSGEPFRVKNWASSSLNVQIPYCTEDIANTSIPKMDFSISDAEGADYQIVGMIAYEVKDTSGQRINCWPVCQFTGNGQKTLTVRWACMGTTRKTAVSINAWVLLKHR